MPRFSLRTLVVVMTVSGPTLALAWWLWPYIVLVLGEVGGWGSLILLSLITVLTPYVLALRHPGDW